MCVRVRARVCETINHGARECVREREREGDKYNCVLVALVRDRRERESEKERERERERERSIGVVFRNSVLPVRRISGKFEHNKR